MNQMQLNRLPVNRPAFVQKTAEVPFDDTVCVKNHTPNKNKNDYL